ncbi:MAG: gliding motility-associated C-terminal domain-containing protein, partial [Saprospiraceae bacterium]
GGIDGTLPIIPAGEAGSDLTNYTFDFGNGALNVNTSSNLAAGPQLVVIRNINNCSIALDTVLSEPILEPTFIVARPTCFGLSDGSIIVDVPNPGEGPFLYDFGDGNDFQPAMALSNLPEGTYNIQVRDANLCLSGQLDILIDQPDELALTTTPTDISCFGEGDGRIVAEVTGGVGNYTYDWSDGQMTNIASNLGAGEYFLAVTDGNDCPVNSDLVVIIEPAELSVAVGQVDNVLCFGETNGAITIDATGGSAPFEYSLDGIIFQPTATLESLPAGDYMVIVKDSRACEVPSENIRVTEPAEFLVTANVDAPITKLGFTINLSAETTTNDGGVNFVWAIPDSIVCNNCPNFSTVPPGSTTYTVTAVNSDNCQSTASVDVAVSLDRPVYIPNIFSPNGDGINDEFFIPFSPAMTEVKELRIYDRTGALVYEAFDIVQGEEILKAWDGEFNGTKIRQGVFVISAQIGFVDGQVLPYQSDVTLITSE